MTNFLTFSLDEGETLHEYYFSESSFEVFNIIEISNTRFFVYGKDSNDKGMVLGLDMEKLFSRTCKGLPEENGSDYFKWNLPTEGCILGKKLSYKKKLPKAECLNGDDFEKLLDRTFCTCTEEDWECDLGF
jgi:hypothetical protein